MFAESNGRIALSCRNCGISVWMSESSVRQFNRDGAFMWRELMASLHLAYVVRSALLEGKAL